jgi:hypothetical protein
MGLENIIIKVGIPIVADHHAGKLASLPRPTLRISELDETRYE